MVFKMCYSHNLAFLGLKVLGLLHFEVLKERTNSICMISVICLYQLDFSRGIPILKYTILRLPFQYPTAYDIFLRRLGIASRDLDFNGQINM